MHMCVPTPPSSLTGPSCLLHTEAMSYSGFLAQRREQYLRANIPFCSLGFVCFTEAFPTLYPGRWTKSCKNVTELRRIIKTRLTVHWRHRDKGLTSQRVITSTAKTPRTLGVAGVRTSQAPSLWFSCSHRSELSPSPLWGHCEARSGGQRLFPLSGHSRGPGGPAGHSAKGHSRYDIIFILFGLRGHLVMRLSTAKDRRHLPT